ncbi:MAG: catalase [Leptospiraceae bacterium]|nr:catalase [Leptospiraceae bacterium]
MKAPSTDWKEDIAPDEEERFAKYAKQFGLLQKVKSKEFGPGRALHRKQVLALKANFEVLGDIPDHARHGLFAFPGNHEAWIRLSNGSMSIQPDSVGDIRGFAVKVRGLEGQGALGGPVNCQDFLLINLPAFSSPKSAQFVSMVGALAQGSGALVKHMISTYGFFKGIMRMKRIASSVNRKFHGFAAEKFYTAAPIACGPYACRVRLLPDPAQKPSGKKDLAADMKDRVQKGSMTMDFQLQFFTDEKSTPVEDASVDWNEKDAPYVTVGRLTVLQQDLDSAEGQAFQEEAEKSVFDPWQALEDHRPLGDVMRARKVVYFASQKGRSAAQ